MSQKPTYEELEQRVKELAESEKKYRHLFETAMVGIYRTCIEDGKFLAANQTLAELMGYDSVDQLIAEYVTSEHYVDSKRREELLRQIQLQGRVDGFEIDMARTDGSVVHIALSAAAYPDRGYLEGVVVDITDRKLAEEALRESEERYRSLVENSLSAIILYRQEKILFANKRFFDIFRYKSNDLRHLLVDDILAPEVTAQVAELRRKRLAGEIEQTAAYESKGKRKDGVIFDMEIFVSVVSCQGDLCCMAFLSDISDRKQAEQALRESEERFRNVYNTAPLAFVVWDRDTRVTDWNKEAEEVFGWSKEEIIGHNFFDFLIPAKDRPHVEEVVDTLLKGELSSHTVNDNLTKEGQIITCEWNNSPLHDDDGNVIGVISLALDITERRKAEEALKESEKRYRTVLEANPDPVIVYDIEGNVVYFNPVFEQVFGWTLEERINKKMDVFVPEDNWPETEMMINKVLAGERFSGIETRRYTKNGNMIPVSVSGSIYKDQGGKPFYTVVNLRDISEQKKLESQLQQAQKMEAIGTLAGGIAHDFNNILGIIIGNTELAIDDVPEGNPARYNLEEIKTAGLRAKDVIRQLLSFSRYTQYEYKPLKIAPIIKESLRFLRASIPTTIEIRQNISDDCDTILANPTQIHQVMINLGTNAAHAMQEKGGLLEVMIDNVRLSDRDISFAPDLRAGKYVKLKVSDTGKGMEPKVQNRIFDPYFTTKNVGKGTGMGLFVIHGIVKEYKGAIKVESKPGKGSTFTLYFPAIEGETIPEIRKFEELPTGNENIMFVDDEASITKMSKEILHRLGYQVESKTNPIDALKLFRAEPSKFDLVIVDMTMPQMTGDALAREILTIRYDIPIILCTGFSEKIDKKMAKEIGIKSFLTKPIVRGEIANVVRQILDGK